VVCDKIDRWSRDPEFTYRSLREIVAAGASFYAVGDQCEPSTPEGDTMLNFRVLFAKEEHKRIKARMIGTRKILRDQGYYVEGLPPFGYRRAMPKGHKGVEKNVLVIEPAEAEFVRRAFRLAAGISLRRIAKALSLTLDRVISILGSRVYLGEIQNSRGEWIKAKHPAILDVDAFTRAQAAIAGRKNGGARGSTWHAPHDLVGARRFRHGPMVAASRIVQARGVHHEEAQARACAVRVSSPQSPRHLRRRLSGATRRHVPTDGGR
jgi:DNA invertase Pin-like site-specific DNA recombinase